MYTPPSRDLPGRSVLVFTRDSINPVVCSGALLMRVSSTLCDQNQDFADTVETGSRINFSHLDTQSFEALYDLLTRYYCPCAHNDETDETGARTFVRSLGMDTAMYILCTLVVFFGLLSETGDARLYNIIRSHLIQCLNNERDFEMQDLRLYIRMYNATRPFNNSRPTAIGHILERCEPDLREMRDHVIQRVCQNYSILMQKDIKIQGLDPDSFARVMWSSAFATLATPAFVIDVLRSDRLMTHVDNNVGSNRDGNETCVDEDFVASHVYAYITFHLFTMQREHARCPSQAQISDILQCVRLGFVRNESLRSMIMDLWRRENPNRADFRPTTTRRVFFPLSTRQRVGQQFWQYVPSAARHVMKPRRRKKAYSSLMSSFRIDAGTGTGSGSGSSTTYGRGEPVSFASMVSEFYVGPVSPTPVSTSTPTPVSGPASASATSSAPIAPSLKKRMNQDQKQTQSIPGNSRKRSPKLRSNCRPGGHHSQEAGKCGGSLVKRSKTGDSRGHPAAVDPADDVGEGDSKARSVDALQTPEVKTSTKCAVRDQTAGPSVTLSNDDMASLDHFLQEQMHQEQLQDELQRQVDASLELQRSLQLQLQLQQPMASPYCCYPGDEMDWVELATPAVVVPMPPAASLTTPCHPYFSGSMATHADLESFVNGGGGGGGGGSPTAAKTRLDELMDNVHTIASHRPLVHSFGREVDDRGDEGDALLDCAASPAHYEDDASALSPLNLFF